MSKKDNSMKITNDHYHHKTTGAWAYEEREIFVTDDRGQTWRIAQTADGHGLKVIALGSGVADDQIQIQPLVGNAIKITSVQP